jgi:PAS domain S-box-containing protein
MAKRGQALRRARAIGKPAKSAGALNQEIAGLKRELARALERQAATSDALTATADVLKVISRSTFDLQTVLETLAESAVRLCAAERGLVFRFDGKLLQFTAGHNVSREFRDFLEGNPIAPGRNSNAGRAALERRTVHNLDVQNDPEYTYGGSRVDPYRTVLAVPMHKSDELVGVFVIYRHEVRAFTDSQIALMETFADQAVIAIENVRLLTEQREALEQQTATAEVLGVINTSPGDLAPVFDAMLEKALRLCDAAIGGLGTWQENRFRFVAARGPQPLIEYIASNEVSLGSREGFSRVARGEGFVQFTDISKSELYESGEPYTRALVDRCGARTTLSVPLAKDDTVLGILAFFRQEVKPFSDKQIALVKNFAAQAVIAMENARLISETREALEQQTATAEVLQVINSSPGDLTPVFDAMLERAMRLCQAAFGFLRTYDGTYAQLVAQRGVPAAYAEHYAKNPPKWGPRSAPARVLEEKRVVQIADAMDTDAYRAGDLDRHAIVDLAGARTLLLVPLLKDDAVLGIFTVYRQEVRPFADKEIKLLESFAAQAVIAMDNARLLEEVRHRNDELAEALEFQTATGEVLRIVASSPDHLQPVFDAMLEKATELCEAKFGTLFLYDGNAFTVVADRNLPPAYAEAVRGKPFSAETNTALRPLIASKAPLHMREMFGDAVYAAREPLRVAAVELGGVRSLVAVPLLKKGELIGFFSIYRDEPGGFAENQIALVSTFADQAVIAIENARLFGELRQRTADLARSVDELTATGEVLKIISRSSVDLETVLNTLVETVVRLCRVDQAQMFRQRDDAHYLVATRGLSEEAEQFLLAHPFTAGNRGTLSGRVELERRAVHIPDVLRDAEYTYNEGQRLAGFRTMLGLPLLREDMLIGILILNRTRVEPFTDKEIELAATFADQAVIAIENARLFDELRERQVELARSVDELTATGDVLKIISRSSTDLGTVLDTLVETVARLCRADKSYMFRRRDDNYHLVTACGLSAEEKEFFDTHPFAADRGSLSGRVELERRPVHIPDVLADPDYTYPGQQVIGYRTLLGIPLLRQDTLLGVFVVNRMHVEPFTDKEIELVTTFADQAVIAIENARLFEELRDRQAELRVTFDNMGDGVAMFDTDRRLAAWNRNLQEMLELPQTVLAEGPSYAELFRYLAERGEFGSVDLEAELRRNLEDTSREMRYERTRPDGRVIEVRRNPVPGGGFVLIYSDITERKRAEAAIGAARDAAESALRELQTAQASLVHAQKMAALGQLTAGIAHEIKNPLNFVNNFAGLSVELLDELKEATAQVMGEFAAEKRAEIVETIGMLTGNLEKIAEHGRRADGIVRSMLQHSRGGSGDWQSTDLNALVEEALSLAYHGARAQDQSFNITMERDLDQNLAPVEVVPQDVMRVFLNLIGNGFYAAAKRGREGDGTFRPVLKVTTRDVGEGVEIGVRDNGVGIRPEHRDKLFQPFFTTKPTGEGTGLGLSISYDIVTQQHGGAITVESEVGQFTEFKVRLPRRRHPTAGRVA